MIGATVFGKKGMRSLARGETTIWAAPIGQLPADAELVSRGIDHAVFRQRGDGYLLVRRFPFGSPGGAFVIEDAKLRPEFDVEILTVQPQRAMGAWHWSARLRRMG